MYDDCKRVDDRRKSSFDFRKNKVNNRKKLRRTTDKINYSIYYIILVVLSSILTLWGYVSFSSTLTGGL